MPGKLAGLLVALVCLARPVIAQQPEATTYSSYKVLAAELVEKRARGVDEPRPPQERALRILDEFVLARLNASPLARLEEINAGLKRFLSSEQPFGEEYTLQAFPETKSAVFALTCNLGLSGPAAVRIYEKKAAGHEWRVNIDQFTDPDFDDAYLKTLLFPPSAGELFVLTVVGRTDSWSTGTFTLWAIAEREVRKAWVAEALAFSSYELVGSELRLEFCEQQDEERPEICRERAREKYVLANGEFRRTEHALLPGKSGKP